MKERNQYFELIRYDLYPDDRASRVEDFYREAAIPAFNRFGINTIGVFKPIYGGNNNQLYILIPHSSLEAVYYDNEKLLADREVLTKGSGFLNSLLNDAPFIKMEKTVLRAFDELPEIRVPINLSSEETKIYEMRIYKSPGLSAAKRKIQMFNEGGELEIFIKTGLQPLFFGETIIGRNLPSLQYMLVFANMEAREKNWAEFENHPDWKKLKTNPNYINIVSCITDIILKPASYSQI
jgi:NIPSNAP